MDRIPSLSVGVVLGLLLPTLFVSRPVSAGDIPGRVYLIRGQGYVFSGGWRDLRDRLRAAGVRADDVSDLSGSWTAADVLADHRAGRLEGPIVFVGHSRGGRQALFAAERLGREGIGIDLLLTADVAVPPPVPANVRRAVNVYLTRNRLYPARPLAGESVIENIDLDAPDSPLAPRGLHHLNITDNPALQEYLFRRILGAMVIRD